jgi:hypothetical protein
MRTKNPDRKWRSISYASSASEKDAQSISPLKKTTTRSGISKNANFIDNFCQK